MRTLSLPREKANIRQLSKLYYRHHRSEMYYVSLEMSYAAYARIELLVKQIIITLDVCLFGEYCKSFHTLVRCSDLTALTALETLRSGFCFEAKLI